MTLQHLALEQLYAYNAYLQAVLPSEIKVQHGVSSGSGYATDRINGNDNVVAEDDDPLTVNAKNIPHDIPAKLADDAYITSARVKTFFPFTLTELIDRMRVWRTHLECTISHPERTSAHLERISPYLWQYKSFDLEIPGQDICFTSSSLTPFDIVHVKVTLLLLTYASVSYVSWCY